MSNELITQQPENTLLTQDDLDNARKLDQMLTDTRRIMAQASPMEKMFTQARALAQLEKMITPAMLKDIKTLMDNPVGFKTDRPPGATDKNGNPLQPYSDQAIKRCVIVGLLKGAALTGNQFNIISSQAYLTKEFLEPAVKNYPGVSEVQVVVGVPSKASETSVLVPGWISLKIHGREIVIECKNNSNDGGIDERIGIIAHSKYATPDNIRGKAIRKLYARAWEYLQDQQHGQGEPPALPEPEPFTEPPKIENQSELPESELPEMTKTGNQEADDWLQRALEIIAIQCSMQDVLDYQTNSEAAIESTAWDADVKTSVVRQVQEFGRVRYKAIAEWEKAE